MKYLRKFIPALMLVGVSAHAAQLLPVDIDGLALEWASTTFEQPAAVHTRELGNLRKRARENLKVEPDNPDLLTWAGIITASYAGSKGGLGALKMAKEAKSYFEKALHIDKDALDGGAATSLGALYYMVPGWPLGFGNDEKAEQLLVNAAMRHPDNVNTLYFYADFLLDQRRFKEARTVFMEAARVPVRKDNHIADTGRQQQISKKLEKLNKITS